jgi:hypothetical protein
MKTNQRLPDVFSLTAGATERSDRPTIFGALSPPNGEEVRRYYARRNAARGRGPVMQRIARYVKANVRVFPNPAD